MKYKAGDKLIIIGNYHSLHDLRNGDKVTVTDVGGSVLEAYDGCHTYNVHVTDVKLELTAYPSMQAYRDRVPSDSEGDEGGFSEQNF